jgi:hypothetical protein
MKVGVVYPQTELNGDPVAVGRIDGLWKSWAMTI